MSRFQCTSLEQALGKRIEIVVKKSALLRDRLMRNKECDELKNYLGAMQLSDLDTNTKVARAQYH